MRTKLDGFGVDPHDFSIIEHTDCQTLPSTSLLNVEVNSNTFSTNNVINVAKDVGTAVGRTFVSNIELFKQSISIVFVFN